MTPNDHDHDAAAGASVIAVWLVPSEPETALLQKLMSRHPEPIAPTSFPHFQPHITLAAIRPPAPAPAPASTTGSRPESSRHHVDDDDDNNNKSTGIDPTTTDPDSTALLALALRESIPLGQRALRVRFARVLTGDRYFLSIYIALAPSIELAQLRSSATAALLNGLGGGGAGAGVGAGGPATPAFPHLSLFYVADEEAHTRVRFLQEMEREGVVRHSADGLSVALRCAAEGDDGDSVLEGFTATQIWIVDCEGPAEEWKVLDKILLATSDR